MTRVLLLLPGPLASDPLITILLLSFAKHIKSDTIFFGGTVCFSLALFLGDPLFFSLTRLFLFTELLFLALMFKAFPAAERRH